MNEFTELSESSAKGHVPYIQVDHLEMPGLSASAMS